MTKDELEAELTQWEDDLRQATHNILELQENFTYKILVGSSKRPAANLVGISASQVRPALKAVEDDFLILFDLIRQVVKEARERWSKLPVLFQQTELNEIEQLLHGQSITLPATPIPLSERTLTSKTQKSDTVTPKWLFDTLKEAFELARDAIFAVEQAWAKNDRQIQNATTALQRLRTLSAELGNAFQAELDQVQRRIEETKQLVDTNPLEVSQDLVEQIMPELERVEGLLLALQAEKDEVGDLLLRSQERLAALRKANEEGKELSELCSAKVVQPVPAQAISFEKIGQLSNWLQTLATTWDAGRWQAVQVGLSNWEKQAAAYEESLTRANARNNELLMRRSELGGLLSALNAKASTLGFSEDTQLVDFGGKAERLLHGRASPLDEAEQLVLAYQERLTLLSTTSTADDEQE